MARVHAHLPDDADADATELPDARHPRHAERESGVTRRRHRPFRLRNEHASSKWTRWLSVLLGLAVVGLLAWAARKVDWPQVWLALTQMPMGTLVAATAVAACSHAVYATYDLMGKAWTGHRIPWSKVMQITFVSYAFNLNLGSLVGGFAFRFRLYSRLGLGKKAIVQILALSLTTNWIGYATLAGAAFMVRALEPPASWRVGEGTLQLVGLSLWAVVAGYLWLCARSQRREFSVRGHEFTLPSGRMAALQLGVSCVNWMIIGAVVWLLMGQAVPYPKVLAVLMTAAVAGVVTHVPAGAGVLEAVFVALLTPEVPTHTLLAALLAYRAIYYLLPLVLATGWYLVLESKGARHLDSQDET